MASFAENCRAARVFPRPKKCRLFRILSACSAGNSHDKWWHRRDPAPISRKTLSPLAAHGLLALLYSLNDALTDSNALLAESASGINPSSGAGPGPHTWVKITADSPVFVTIPTVPPSGLLWLSIPLAAIQLPSSKSNRVYPGGTLPDGAFAISANISSAAEVEPSPFGSASRSHPMRQRAITMPIRFFILIVTLE